jgi:LysR family hydrogen peroxide-inducible transcriptional activator
MELHQLRYFVAVADVGSFTHAAQRCYVAQPSLSQQIIKLERALGQPLFERLGRTVRLTPAGRTLYERAVAILAAVEDARRRVSGSGDDGQGTVVVGVIPTIAPYLLPPAVREFQRRYPRSAVVIHEDLTEHTVENCLRGDLDLGIVALPIIDPQLHVEPLGDDELQLALPTGHRLLKQRHVTIEDLDGEPFILLSEAHCLGQQVVSLCNQQSCQPAVTCRSAQLLTVQELIAAGQGISLIPAMAARGDRSPRRKYRSFSGTRPARTLGLIWHHHRYQPPVVRRFIDLMRSSAPQALADPRLSLDAGQGRRGAKRKKPPRRPRKSARRRT